MRDKLQSDLKWGTLFAKRDNFEGGFFDEERRFVQNNIQPKSTILIIASGNGREARPISKEGHFIVCMDNSFFYLFVGSRLFSREGLGGINFLQADFFSLPFKDNCFDFIFYSMYSFSGSRRLEVLKSIRKILRPGGNVMLVACTPDYIRAKGPKASEADDFFYLENEMILKDEVSSCGFDMIESSLVKIRPEYRISLLSPKKN